jgi:hypothetical protein
VKEALTQEEIDMFTNPELINLVAQNSYNCHDYGAGLAHLCFMNEELSHEICNELLIGINKNLLN